MTANTQLIHVGLGECGTWNGRDGGDKAGADGLPASRGHISQWMVVIPAVLGFALAAFGLIFAESLRSLAWYSGGAACALLIAAKWTCQLRENPCMIQL